MAKTGLTEKLMTFPRRTDLFLFSFLVVHCVCVCMCVRALESNAFEGGDSVMYVCVCMGTCSCVRNSYDWRKFLCERGGSGPVRGRVCTEKPRKRITLPGCLSPVPLRACLIRLCASFVPGYCVLVPMEQCTVLLCLAVKCNSRFSVFVLPSSLVWPAQRPVASCRCVLRAVLFHYPVLLTVPACGWCAIHPGVDRPGMA